MRQSIVLKDEKGSLTQQYRAILAKVTADKRTVPNTDEKAQLEKMDARFEELDEAIALHEKQENRETAGSARNSGNGITDPANEGGEGAGGVRASKDYQKASRLPS